MKHAHIGLVALAAMVIAGCGGGDSVKQSDLDKVKEELETTKDQLETAQDDLKEAQDNLKDAQDEIDETEKERDEAEAQKDDLEEQVGKNASQIAQINARQVYIGLDAFIGDSADDTSRTASTPIPTGGGTAVSVSPRYLASAEVTTNPEVEFSVSGTGRSGDWFRTSFSRRSPAYTDRLDVYADAGTPSSTPFEESEYVADGSTAAKYDPSDASVNSVIDDGKVIGSVLISGLSGSINYVSSSLFPKSGDPEKEFDRRDRGQFTTEQRREQNLPADNNDYVNHSIPSDYTGQYRDGVRYPLRYVVEVDGKFSGVAGKFTCATNDDTDDACTVTNRNASFTFGGPWVFTPSSASAQIRIEDDEFMYFGWWARQSESNGEWSFRTFHGPSGTGTSGNRSAAGDLEGLSGTATYTGVAAGQYSFAPLGSKPEHGEFTAKASLTANFTDSDVRGTIDGFSGHPDWTVTLKSRAISGGSVPTGTSGDAVNAVTWEIDGEGVPAPGTGTWEAAFYSNLPNAQRTGVTPTGMAGTFEAEYHERGRMWRRRLIRIRRLTRIQSLSRALPASSSSPPSPRSRQLRERCRCLAGMSQVLSG